MKMMDFDVGMDYIRIEGHQVAPHQGVHQYYSLIMVYHPVRHYHPHWYCLVEVVHHPLRGDDEKDDAKEDLLLFLHYYCFYCYCNVNAMTMMDFDYYCGDRNILLDRILVAEVTVLVVFVLLLRMMTMMLTMLMVLLPVVDTDHTMDDEEEDYH